MPVLRALFTLTPPALRRVLLRQAQQPATRAGDCLSLSFDERLAFLAARETSKKTGLARRLPESRFRL